MSYSVKELFYTVQGEGLNAGRPAVFCRFSGCNLWSGREVDKPKALCQFCDTDFVGTDGPGGRVFATEAELAVAAGKLWPSVSTAQRFIVCTGGEPLLQLNERLVEALKECGFEVAIETNGTLPVPPGIDWICVSPKGHAPLTVLNGNELKVVFPQDGLDPAAYEAFGFDYFLIQPMDGPERQQNTRLAVDYCLTHPKWRLSLQLHKIVGMP